MGISPVLTNYLLPRDQYIIKGKFYPISWHQSNKWKHMALRLILIGGFLSKPIREIIKMIIITRKKESKINFSRKLILNTNSIKIIDHIKSRIPLTLFSIDKFSYRYIPSAKFFQLQEINGDGIKYIGKEKIFEVKNEIKL